MNEEIILNYILKSLEYDITMLKCINLGMSPTEHIKCEIIMADESIKYIKKLMKERKIKQWLKN